MQYIFQKCTGRGGLNKNLLENITLITLKGDVSSTTAVGSKSLIEVESELNKAKAELDNTMSEQNKFKTEVAAKQKQLNETISKQEEELSAVKLEKERLKNQVIILKSKWLFRIFFDYIFAEYRKWSK